MKKSLRFALGITLSSIYLLTGCSDDENPEPNDGDSNAPIETGYAISTVSGAWPDMTTYIQWADDLSFSSIGNESAVELTGSASTVTFDGATYATPLWCAGQPG